MLVINVNDFVMKFKFDNKYGCKEFVVDVICCVIDVMMVGKVVVVVGYGDVGKGIVVFFCGVGCWVIVSEIDLICVLQVVMDGFEVKCMENVILCVDIIVMVIGNKDIISEKYFKMMKDKAIVCNIGYFDNEIDVVYFNCEYGYIKIEIKL